MTIATSAPQVIIVFAHGSRDPQWRQPVESVASRLSALAPESIVRCAYLELCQPDLVEAFDAARGSIESNDSIVDQGLPKTCRIFPLFFGVGKHAREDLPQLVGQLRAQYSTWTFEVTPSAGEFDAVLDAAALSALSSGLKATSA